MWAQVKSEEAGEPPRLLASNQPLYNQPLDTGVYQQNRTSYRRLKPVLVSYVRRRHQQLEQRARQMVDVYTQQMATWIREIERLESQPVGVIDR